jgi:quinol monooxygenase YgiN
VIEVIAIVTTKPRLRASVLSMFLEHVVVVRRERGCIEYAPAVDIDDAPHAVTLLGPDTFVVLEKWNSREDLVAHEMSADHKAYRSRVDDLLVSRVIHVVELITPKRSSPVHGGAELKNYFPASR